VLLRDEFVLVDQATESVAAPDAVEFDHVGGWPLVARRGRRERWPLCERAMRPVFVVVRRVLAQHQGEVAAAENEEPVEAFAKATAAVGRATVGDSGAATRDAMRNCATTFDWRSRIDYLRCNCRRSRHQ
jgi:hypothetical protein